MISLETLTEEPTAIAIAIARRMLLRNGFICQYKAVL
jgi:hypothetical protein